MEQQKMARPLRISVQLHQQHTTYQSFADTARRVEEMGVDAIFDCDHFFPLYGPADGWHFEGWTLLTALAMLTTRVEIGCLVTCAAYRNPALLSNMAKTLDHISQGRLILGLGAGILERDFSEYGYEFGTPASRLATLEQTLQVIEQRWEVDVPPPTRRIPILIGGGGERKTLRLAAQHASIWHGFGDPATYRHKVEVLHTWCERVGRSPQEIECAVSLTRWSSPEDLDAYVAAGATHFLVSLGRPALNLPWDVDRVAKMLAWRESRR